MSKPKITTADVIAYMQQTVNELAANFEGYSSIDMTARYHSNDKPPKVEFSAYNSRWGVSGDFADPSGAIADLVRISKTKKQSELLREQAEAILIKAEVLKKNGY